MDSLNELEIQNIRHLCGASCNLCTKITYYKTLTQDEKVLNTFDSICQNLDGLKSTLSNML